MRACRATALCVLLALAACTAPSPPAPSAPPLPRRIVSLAPALTEMLFALGAGDRVVGVTAFCDDPPEAASRPRVGGYADPSVEAILALRPDLVVVSPNVGNRDAALAVQRAGTRLEVVPAETLEETYAALRTLGELTGTGARAGEIEREIRGRLENLARRLAGRPAVPTLFCLEADPLIVAGRGTLPAELLERAGGRNVVEASRYPRVGVETVLAAAPAVILQTPMDASQDGSEAERHRVLAFWSRWPTLPAVQAGRVHLLPAGTALRPGTRVAEAAETLAALLHPEVPPR